MTESKKSLLQDKFSHIYIEKAALSHPVANNILENFPNAVKIEIEHYKDFFTARISFWEDF